MVWPSLAFLGAATFTAAVKVGYFDSEKCVDGTGLQKCYASAESAWKKCVHSQCDEGDRSCHEYCPCIRSRERINCAASHCWNQGYSCEYQRTVGDMAKLCSVDFADIPFYPAPDNAPGSCSCNLGKIAIAFSDGLTSIGECAGKGIVGSGDDATEEEFQVWRTACICCGRSAQISAFYNICPEIDPVSLGIDEPQFHTVHTFGEWSECGKAMAQIPCGKGGFDFTPSGNNSSAKFYAPGGFPSNGTRTATNLPGTMTLPASAATLTRTVNGLVQTITMASTQTQDGGNDSNEKANEDESSDKAKDVQTHSGSENNTQNQGSNNDDQSTAHTLSPGLLVVSSILILSSVLW